MKLNETKPKILALFLSTLILLSSCSSSTVITSSPDNAKVYLNGELVGITPHKITDAKTTGATSHIKLEKEGYEDFHATFYKNEKVNVGALIGGVFFLVPFLWIMKYKSERSFEMKPLSEVVIESSLETKTKNTPLPKKLSQEEKAEQLKALKPLLDKGEISRKEYDLLRKEILKN